MSYLFLAIPPHCGSTAIHNYLAECAAVVPLLYTVSKTGFIEGNMLLTGTGYFKSGGLYQGRLAAIIPANYMNALQDPNLYSWPGIKAVWDANWALNPKKGATVFLQKTPNDVYRVQMMQPYFPGCKWIIVVRNPYAYVESIIETMIGEGIDPVINMDGILNQAIACLDIQMQNKNFLGANAYTVTYEDLVANTDKHVAALKVFMPELSDLSFSGDILMKGKFIKGLIDNNASRIAKLQSIPGAMAKVNAYFSQHTASLAAWGYSLIS